MSESNIAANVKSLYKSFKLPHDKHSGIKQILVNITRRKSGFEVQHVLGDVSFEIKKGEFFGIVGRNGSGKSTLLKLLAGIYVPDSGLVQVNGSLTPFIELGVGFNVELTGRENVFMNGAMLGFSRKEMEAMYNDIVDFAELSKFMDQKLKNYSSGMQVRLAFSIAIRADSDILLIDEVLAVGDAAFQQKCYDYFDKLKESDKTIILVTHDMGAVKQFCDRALLIKDGRVAGIGKPGAIARKYEEDNFRSLEEQPDGPASNAMVGVTIKNESGKSKDAFGYGEDAYIEVNWKTTSTVSLVGLVIYKGDEAVYATNSFKQEASFSGSKAKLKVKLKIGAGRYKVSATLFGENRRSVVAVSEYHSLTMYDQPLTGVHADEWQGIVYLDNKWS